MNKQDQEQLKKEISHIFESDANEIRIFEMVNNFIDKRYVKNHVIDYFKCNCTTFREVNKINDKFICCTCNNPIY
jgi:hypothetical protein